MASISKGITLGPVELQLNLAEHPKYSDIQNIFKRQRSDVTSAGFVHISNQIKIATDQYETF